MANHRGGRRPTLVRESRLTRADRREATMSQPDMHMILQQAQRMQRQLADAQEELARAEVTGQAGNGLVKVTRTASGDVREIIIDPKVVDPQDVETLQDLIVGAIEDAA